MKKLFSKSILALLVATVIFSNTAFAQSKSKPKIGDTGPGGGKSDWYLPSREELKYINYKYSDNLKHSGFHLHTTQCLHALGTRRPLLIDIF